MIKRKGQISKGRGECEEEESVRKRKGERRKERGRGSVGVVNGWSPGQ